MATSSSSDNKDEHIFTNTGMPTWIHETSVSSYEYANIGNINSSMFPFNPNVRFTHKKPVGLRRGKWTVIYIHLLMLNLKF